MEKQYVIFPGKWVLQDNRYPSLVVTCSSSDTDSLYGQLEDEFVDPQKKDGVIIELSVFQEAQIYSVDYVLANLKNLGLINDWTAKQVA